MKTKHITIEYYKRETNKVIERNLLTVKGFIIAFDGCHKIYICETEQDLEQAVNSDYELYKMEELQKVWDKSCSLRFISNWKLDKIFIPQGEYFDII